MKNKLLVFSLFLVFILVLSQTRTPIAHIIERDPPSVFNFGPGGITTFYYREYGKRRVSILYNLQELRGFDPQSHVLMLLSPDRRVENVNYLVEWVDSGGVAVICDELNYSIDVLKVLGIEYNSDVSGIAVARCALGNETIDILIDVAKKLKAVNSDAKPLCFYGIEPIAYNVSLGRGYAIIVGDSSLVINEILSQPTIAKNNTKFVEFLINDRNLLIYEGSRLYTPIYAQVIAQYIDVVLNGLTRVLRWVISERGAVGSLGVALGVTAILMMYIALRFGIQTNPKKYLQLQSTIRNTAESTWERLLIGVSAWEKLEIGMEKE
uniref:DUF4350 domain-containing protein n=1 Tax=Ignisphaera aggregans TaxID=334771 RepID=A0A7C4FBA4_9CREN